MSDPVGSETCRRAAAGSNQGADLDLRTRQQRVRAAQGAGRDARRDRGARIAVINGKGHEIYADRAEDCTAAVLEFIESLRA